MDNNQKIDQLFKFERRAKRKKIILGVLSIILVGSLMFYLQYENFENAYTIVK